MSRRAPAYKPLALRPRDLSAEQLAAQPGMTIAEAAEYLRVSRRTVEKLVASGELPSALIRSCRIVYRAGVELYFAQQRA